MGKTRKGDGKLDDNGLKWEKGDSRELLRTRVFTVLGQTETSPAGYTGEYIALDAPDCVVVIPETEGSFVTVRQWRHGAGALTSEFPGGVIDGGESPSEAAYRELLEETGFRAGKLTLLGVSSPNPALFRSRLYFFLAEELEATGVTHPDPDELISVRTVKKEEFFSAFGGGEVSHAFTGTALLLYLRYRGGAGSRS